jgi:hypothetical protein
MPERNKTAKEENPFSSDRGVGGDYPYGPPLLAVNIPGRPDRFLAKIMN